MPGNRDALEALVRHAMLLDDDDYADIVPMLGGPKRSGRKR